MPSAILAAVIRVEAFRCAGINQPDASTSNGAQLRGPLTSSIEYECKQLKTPSSCVDFL